MGSPPDPGKSDTVLHISVQVTFLLWYSLCSFIISLPSHWNCSLDLILDQREAVVNASDSGYGIAGSSPDDYTSMHNILGQDVYSQVLRPARPFIRPGSISWYLPRLGLSSSVQL
jgi:hypothetical protein